MEWATAVFPSFVERWVGEAWLPILKKELQAYPQVGFWTRFHPDKGLLVALHWFQPYGFNLTLNTDSSPDTVNRLMLALASRSSNTEEYSASSTPMIHLWTETRRVPELVNWITFVSQSVAQSLESEEEEEPVSPGQAKQLGAKETPPQTEAERKAEKGERRARKARLRAIVRELTNPATTARVVSSLGDWTTLDIRKAGLSGNGRWTPDWEFVASADNEQKVGVTALAFFRVVAAREPRAALRPEDEASSRPLSSTSPLPTAGDSRASSVSLEPLRDPMVLDLPQGRLRLQIPGDDTLRIGLYRYRRPGERQDRPPMPTPGQSGPADWIVLRGSSTPADSLTTPVLGLQVDWARLAADLRTLVRQSEELPGERTPSPGVLKFMKWAEWLARTGPTRFLIFSGPKSSLWVLHLPLRS